MGGLLRGRRGIPPARALREVLNGVRLVDHHAHAVLRRGPATLEELRGLFSESLDPRQWAHAANTLTYRRAMREIAAELGCEPTEEAVLAARRAADPRAYAGPLLAATATDWLLLDDGFPPTADALAPEAMAELAGARAARVMRIERVADEALAGSPTLGNLRERVRTEVAGARAAGAVALKTIAAYRSGLDVGPPDPGAAAAELASVGPRLRGRALVDLLLWDALEANAPDPLPVQVHAGFGDPDLRLARADPSHLAPAVERFPETPFVLLHCYPFVRQAAWMASVYANVWMDLSLTIPHISRPAEALREALELAPLSKLLYASDASRTPELYLLAARWWRDALAEVLPEALPRDEAERAARWILRETAIELYGLR
jgi:predicted TIM-barrel fold metal-dependent hydrolase